MSKRRKSPPRLGLVNLHEMTMLEDLAAGLESSRLAICTGVERVENLVSQTSAMLNQAVALCESLGSQREQVIAHREKRSDAARRANKTRKENATGQEQGKDEAPCSSSTSPTGETGNQSDG